MRDLTPREEMFAFATVAFPPDECEMPPMIRAQADRLLDAVEAAARAAVLRLGADSIEQEFHANDPAETEREEAWNTAVRASAAALRRMADVAAAGQAPAPQPETTPDAACARCGHAAADHGKRHCRFELCDCPRDGAGATAYWPLIDPGAARWIEHGTTWTRDEYGNAHSLATAPDAEPGTPDDARDRLRQDIALAIARADRTGALGAPEDRAHEYLDEADAVLAVRDDALTTTQQRITAALAECDRIEAAVRDNPQDPDFDGAYLACLRHIHAALTGGTTTHDGGQP